MSFRTAEEGVEAPGLGNMTVDDVSTWVLEHAPQSYQRMVASNYSYGIERDEARLRANDRDFTKWSNPLEIRYTCSASYIRWADARAGCRTRRA